MLKTIIHKGKIVDTVDDKVKTYNGTKTFKGDKELKCPNCERNINPKDACGKCINAQYA